MSDLITPWLIVLVSTGILFSIFGYILKRYPPRKINWFYGYRTSSSMKNQERWDFAQRYAAREMMRQGFWMILFGFAGAWLPLSPALSAFLTIPVMFLLIGLLIFRTEKALKNKFEP